MSSKRRKHMRAPSSNSERDAVQLKKSSLPNIQYAASGSGDSVVKCRGEFCQSSLASLPGLLRVLKSLRKLNESIEENNIVGDDDPDQTVVEDTGQRFKMGNNNLLLAHAELDFLRESFSASASPLDESALAFKWQEADNVFRTELGRSNPAQFYKQVFVCANCHRVYSEINKVRDKGFQSLQNSISNSTDNNTELELSKMATKDPIADDSTDAYDKMFLDELSKQSEALGGERHRHPHKNNSLKGPEHEDNVERPASGSSSSRERPVLPSLQSALTQAKHKKKVAGVATDTNGRSNQQVSTSYVHGSEQLADKMANLEAELLQTRQKLTSVESRKHKLEQEIIQTRSQCAAKLREKDDQSRKQLLELEYSFHAKQSNSKPQRIDGERSSAEEITQLIETIDSLNLQLDQANNGREQAKKKLVQAQQSELKKVHEKYQLDMETLRLSEHAAKEQVENLQMQMLNLQSQAQISATQSKNTKAALEDLTKNKVVVLEEKNQRLERQLAALKVQQRNLGQSSGGMLNMVASSSSVPKQDVEAMEKHLNNKIEYLKAQLASEMKCKEELGSHLAQITSAMEKMKTDKRQALAEQDETFKRQIERIESTFSQEKEVMTTQQAALQGKVVMLQANVTDLIQELTMWKSKETNAKLAIDKMVEENVRLTRQLVDAEGQVESLQEERKQDAAKAGSMSVMNASEETKRVQMEALLRRLDNERQYLKSQLEGQQELKEKSQKLVTDLQYEIREVKDAMEESMQVSEKRISELTTEKRNQEQELKGTIECLEEGKRLLNRQLKEVQTKFADAREQALLERDEIEKARIEVNEMRAQLLAAKEDSVKEQSYAKNASERMSKSLAAVKSSLKTMEEEKSKQIRRLEDENTEYIRKLATTQGEMLVLEEKFAAENMRDKKDKATANLAMVLNEKAELWRIRTQYRTFMHMQLHAKLFRLQTSLERRRTEELGVLEDRIREDYMAKCDEMTQTLHDERLEALRSMKESHDKDREELNEFYLQEKSQLEEELTALHAAQLQQIKEQYASASKSAEVSAESTIEELRRQNDQLTQGNNQLAEELAEMTQKCEMMSCTFEGELGALRLEWERKEADWKSEEMRLQEELRSQRGTAKDQLSLETSRLVTAHARQLADVQALHEAKQDERAKQFVDQVAMLLEEQSQKYTAFHAAEVATKAIQHQTELEEAIASVTQRWQKEIDRQREAHDHALQDAVVKAETRANAQLATLQKEMNERKGTAVVKCTSKWQRAMEELQERQEVEKRTAYNEGQQDREKEWQQAAQQIKERQKEELDKVQQEAVAAIRAAEERHEMRFKAQLADTKKQLEEQHAQSIQALTDEITTRERELAQEHLEANNDVLEQELTAKWTLQLEELQTQLDAKLQEEKARLSIIIEEKEALVLKIREDHAKQLVELEKTWVEKLEALTASTADTHKQDIDTLRKELENEHDASVKQLQDDFVKQVEDQLRDQETRLLRDQEDAIAQVQDDSEKLIDQVEHAMEELKKQKEHLESELLGLRSALEEAEDAHFDAQESFKKQQKQAAFHILHLLMRAQKKLVDAAHDHQVSRTELEDKCIRLKETFAGEKAQWEELLARVKSTWSQVQSQHVEMTQTLTNYRRDELVAHRSTSAVLSNEISIVTKQLEEVEEMKVTLERDVEALQTEAHSVEAALRDLMLQSGGSNSSLNMAVVAKKRRLNEEFETLLERIEKKKSEVRTVEQTIAALRARREEKEQEMRQMERKLVEILVQQQKQMLSLVSAVQEVPLPTST